MSGTWEHFKVSEHDPSKAICGLCKSAVSRGGKLSKTWGTSNLWKHLKQNHKSIHEDLSKKAQAEAAQKLEAAKRKSDVYVLVDQPAMKQQKLSDMFEKAIPYKDSDKAQKSHEKHVAQWLCDSMTAYNAVDNKAFQDMIHDLDSRINCRTEKHYRTKVVPDIHERLRSKIKQIMSDLENVKYVCGTTDFWSAENRDEFMAWTAHFINKHWKRKMAVLGCTPSNESHTAEKIGEWMREILSEWELHNRCQLVLRDNASNLVNALKTIEIESFGCFLHTLNLVVQHSLFAEDSPIKGTINRAQELTRYFRRQKTQSQLEAAQKQLGLPCHKLKFAEPTRWNTYEMQFERQYEQRHAIKLAISWLMESEPKSKQPPKIPNSDWPLIENSLELLKIAAEMTTYGEREDACISEVIPCVMEFERQIKAVTFSGAQPACTQLREEMLRQTRLYFGGLDKRDHFVDVNKCEPCFLATILDPRFKTKVFEPNLELQGWGRVRLEVALQELDQRNSAPPSPAAPAMQPSTSGKKRNFFRNIMNISPQQSGSGTPQEKNEKMVAEYLNEPTIDEDADPLEYWKVNESKWKKLAQLAKRYLAAPLSTVASERTFKAAKMISEGDRSSLIAEHVEMLLFCKYNLRAVNYDY